MKAQPVRQKSAGSVAPRTNPPVSSKNGSQNGKLEKGDWSINAVPRASRATARAPMATQPIALQFEIGPRDGIWVDELLRRQGAHGRQLVVGLQMPHRDAMANLLHDLEVCGDRTGGLQLEAHDADSLYEHGDTARPGRKYSLWTALAHAEGLEPTPRLHVTRAKVHAELPNSMLLERAVDCPESRRRRRSQKMDSSRSSTAPRPTPGSKQVQLQDRPSFGNASMHGGWTSIRVIVDGGSQLLDDAIRRLGHQPLGDGGGV